MTKVDQKRHTPAVVAWRYDAQTFLETREFIEQIQADHVAFIERREWKSGILLHTPEGERFVERGDYITKRSNGDFHVCKPETFDRVIHTLIE